jgi:thiamine-phosphate pyrophosphorylase
MLHMGTLAEDRRERLARMRLYVITGDRGDMDETVAIVEAALEGGADVIQLRKKTMPKAEQYRLAVALRRLTRAHDALLIVNDHPDLAIVADADGVHLGQDEFPPAIIRGLNGFAGRLLGRSTHSLDQALAAVENGVDYLGVGPVFETPTKAGRPAVGCGLVTEIAARVDRPFVAIGGIDLQNAPTVVDAGAPAIAVVRAVYDAADPAEAARRLRAIIKPRLEAARP